MSFEVRKIQPDRKKSNHAAAKKAVKAAGTIIPWGIWAAKPLAHWYSSWKERQKKEKIHNHRVLILKRVFAILISLLVATALLALIAQTVFSIQFSFRKMLSVAGADLPVDANGFTNILLLGSGDDNHEGKDLLDTIIVASIDPETESAVMLSLPRDLYVLKTDNMGEDRINSLYRDYKGYLLAQGKTEPEASHESLIELKDEIGRKIGLQIHHALKVNFTAFEEGVDAIGGIDIEVPKDIVDTEYPGPNWTYQTFQISKGPHHLDGATALMYARSRHSTSDFDRSARQQQILLAAVNKAKSAKLHRDVSKITEIYGILSKNTETTLAMREILTLASMADDFSTEKIVMMQLNDQNGLFGGFVSRGGFLYAPPREQFSGAAVLLPVSIPDFPISWKQLQTLTKLMFGHRELFLAPAPKIAVLNAGAPSGAGRALGGELLRYGFDVVEIDNDPAGKSDTSSIGVRPAPPDQDQPWEKHYNFLKDLIKLPEGAFPPETIEGNPDIVLRIGRDFDYKPMQDLLP